MQPSSTCTGLLRLLWSDGLSDARRLLTLGDTFDGLHKQDMTQAQVEAARKTLAEHQP